MKGVLKDSQGTPGDKGHLQEPPFPNQVTPEPIMDAGKLWEPKSCSPRANT